MRRFMMRAVMVGGTLLVLTACSNSGDATEQSLVRTATAFSSGVRPSLASATATPRSAASPSSTARMAASVIVPGTPTPLPALVASVAAIRIGSAVSGASASPTPTPRPTGPTPTPAPQVVTIVADSSVNLRSDAASDAEVVTQVPPGADVIVVQTNVPATDGGDIPWVRVTYNGQTGYIRNDLVGPLHPAGAASTAATANPSASVTGSPITTHVVPTLANTPTPRA